MEGTLARRLGITTHVSSLRFKLRRMRERYPVADAVTLEDWLLDLANARGVTVVSRSLSKLDANPGSFPTESEVTNAELIVGICQVEALDRPQWLRAAAQLISRGFYVLDELFLLGRRERVERILRELSKQALKVEASHPGWRPIFSEFEDERPLRDSLLHWSRLAEPIMRPGRPNAEGWKLVR